MPAPQAAGYLEPVSDAARDLLRQALQLPLSERASLVSELVASLDGEPDEDVEAAWAAELERRVEAARAGRGGFEDWQAVRDRLRAR